MSLQPAVSPRSYILVYPSMVEHPSYGPLRDYQESGYSLRTVLYYPGRSTVAVELRSHVTSS